MVKALLVAILLMGIVGNAEAKNRRHYRHYHTHHVLRGRHVSHPVRSHIASAFEDRWSGLNDEYSLIDRARSYLGTNPTGWHSVWCAHFMAMLLPMAAKQIKDGADYALNWAELPHTTPHVGAIAVLRRNGGGHVGIVTGFKDGNPILISGNHGHRVGEGVYPRGRVVAYVQARG